mgnify:FL=1
MDDPIKTARELATHANDIKHLQADMDRMVQDMSEVKTCLASINKTLSEARGGWQALMYVGGASAVIASMITWAFDKFIK